MQASERTLKKTPLKQPDTVFTVEKRLKEISAGVPSSVGTIGSRKNKFDENNLRALKNNVCSIIYRPSEDDACDPCIALRHFKEGDYSVVEIQELLRQLESAVEISRM